MRLRAADMQILRGPLGWFVACALISVAMIGASVYFKTTMAREYRTQHDAFRAASRKYLSVDADERLIEEYLPRFNALSEAGIIGNEHRLNWLEVLREAGAEIGLPAVEYQIETQRHHDSAELPNSDYAVRVSRMSLTMRLLHEGDLFRLLAKLDRDAHGLFSVEQCDLKRADLSIVREEKVPRLDARCDFDWFTLAPPEEFNEKA